MNSNKVFLAVLGLLMAMAVVSRIAPAAAIWLAFGLLAAAYVSYSRFRRP